MTTQSIADLTTEIKLTKGDIPPPLVGASTTVAGNNLYVFGGRLVSSRQMINDLYILDLNTFVWTHRPSLANAPQARYFHSANLFKNQLVIFGGMSYSQQQQQTQAQQQQPGLCTLDDVCLLDLDTLNWHYPETQPSLYTPQARYAHLTVICSEDKLVVMGGQDMSNQYINELNIFDLTRLVWTHGTSLNRQYGAYRSVAFCPPATSWKKSATTTATATSTTDDETICCVYSNYNFTDVTRDLQSFCPFSTEFNVRDDSADMSGVTLPPGLRFPSGDLLGHHLILTGTYLTPTHRSFHIWALNLTNLVWTRIETGTILSHGSWNRGVLHAQRFLVFGDKTRDLLEDYNHRQVNFGQLAVVELEAFGIYVTPAETCPAVAQELGLSMLSGQLADMAFQTEDGQTIPANSTIVRLRWPTQPLGDLERRLLYFPESYAVTLAFLQYLYTDHLLTAQQHQPHVVSRLLILADMHRLPRLAQLATHALHQLLTISTASLVYETAALSGRIALQIRALRVMINAKKMLQHDDTARRLMTASKSSSTATSSTQQQRGVLLPSPKLSKSSHHPGFLERKASMVQSTQHFIDRPNMGVPF
ncbi:MAG: hypothetical protein EXX96DRAFT_106804 [Benjaminiella poitrasii]|nr:MAG: hypothetical protein EXX96DRAFT_106804 [Benjaminiella poitrasii]